MSIKFLFLISAILLFVSASSAHLSEVDRSWNQPVEPFKIAGNIYYVGARPPIPLLYGMCYLEGCPFESEFLSPVGRSFSV